MNIMRERKASICKNGHSESYTMELYEKYDGDLYCKICGSEILFACPSCNSHIVGKSYVEGIIDLTSFNLPNNCNKCGEAFPWNRTSKSKIRLPRIKMPLLKTIAYILSILGSILSIIVAVIVFI